MFSFDPPTLAPVNASAATTPGVLIERRRTLWLPFAVVAGTLVRAAPIQADDRAGALDSAPGTSALTPLTLEQFGRCWTELAAALKQATKDSDEIYAARLAAELARVPVDALPRLQERSKRNGIRGGLSWSVAECVTVEFTMDPGAALPHHNHPPQVVLTLCTDGEVRYEHYEIEGDAPPCTQIDGKEFRIRESRSGFLGPRRSTSLTRVRDGIHGFTAGKQGARIIDFTFSLTDDIDTFSYVDRSPEPVDPERRIYGAVWAGK